MNIDETLDTNIMCALSYVKKAEQILKENDILNEKMRGDFYALKKEILNISQDMYDSRIEDHDQRRRA